MNLLFRNIILLIGILILVDQSFSQFFGTSPKSTGLGFSGTIYSKGIEAISINSANISLDSSVHYSLTLLPLFSFNIDNNVMNLDIFNKYFSGVNDIEGNNSPRYLTKDDKEYLLSQFPVDKGLDIYSNLDFNIFSFICSYPKNYGSIAFSVKEKVFGTTTLPKEIFRLLFYGNPVNSSYYFDNFDSYFSWAREFSISYARKISINKILSLSAGISLKYLNGYAFGKIDNFKSSVLTSDSSVTTKINIHSLIAYSDFLDGKSRYSIFGNQAGSGFSGDIGFSLRVGESHAFGLSITDIGFINWRNNVKEISIDTIFSIKDFSEKEQVNNIKTIIKDNKKNRDQYKQVLPFGIHLGMMIELDKLKLFRESGLFPVLITSDLHSTFLPDFSWKTYTLISFGLEFKIVRWLPVRTGFSVGSIPFSLSFGFGINTKHFDFDIGVGNVLIATRYSKRISLSVGSLLRF